MKMYLFEGSPEEISRFLETTDLSKLGDTLSAETSERPPQSNTLSKSMDGRTKFVTTEFARRALRRLPLSPPLRSTIETLFTVHPDWVSAARLHEVTGYDRSQFAGMMGAFGRRMCNTEGYDPQACFFDFRRNDQTEAWEYRLPDSVREALDTENLF